MGARKAQRIGEIVGELRRLAEKLKVYKLRSLVLFGSYARGEQLAESDVDLIVVAEGFNGLPFYEREYLVYKMYSGKLPLEAWCYTPREVLEALQGRPRIDIIDALENGIVIYDDGFWTSLRQSGVWRRYRRTWYGGLKLN